ncbi:hypothetical protein Hanom_Chr02g00106821 [Helianthus anomalus]
MHVISYNRSLLEDLRHDKIHFCLVPGAHEAVMSYQNSVNMFPWRGSFGGWQVVACTPTAAMVASYFCFL